MPDLSLFSALGLLGVALYLGAYAALQMGLIRGSSLSYTLLNLCAAASVLVSLIESFNFYSAMTQVFWIVMSLYGLVRRVWLRSQLSFSEEERGFLARHLPTLPPIDAFRVIRLGRWEQVPPGTRLTRQGEEVGALYYLAQGRMKVEVDGRTVTELAPGALIGEMTLMHGGGATADLVVTEAARLFRLPREPLLKEITAAPDVALAISQSLQDEVQRKLTVMNTGPGPDPAPPRATPPPDDRL